jgi:multidrug efflux pump subunit AcrA (membrane-fusion protein)
LTRTFLVKAALPKIPGIYPGMFGRLLIPVGQHKVILIPAQAIQRVGQLETVMVRTGDHFERIFVTSGPTHDGRIEILSGLKADDVLSIGDTDD